MKQFFKSLFLTIVEYYTPKIVLIRSLKIGICNRLLQMAIILYFIFYSILEHRGYQSQANIDSNVAIKVKGVFYTNFSDSEFNDEIPDKSIYRRIWDPTDYVVPSTENNAFFIMTNVRITKDQTIRTCPEDPDVPKAICQSNSDCAANTKINIGSGILTGNCVVSRTNSSIKTCEVTAWCPVEMRVNPLKNNRALLLETKESIVFVRNYVLFDEYHIQWTNLPFSENATKATFCRYNRQTDPHCPIFRIGDIVEDFDKVAYAGATIAMDIHWDCNFDKDIRKCRPEYSFTRLDTNMAISPSFDYRFAHYYNYSTRTLYKAIGLNFVIFTEGSGRRFDIVPLIQNIGSGLGLLAYATVLTDVLVLHFVQRKKLYKKRKFEEVDHGSSVQRFLGKRKKEPKPGSGPEIIEMESSDSKKSDSEANSSGSETKNPDSEADSSEDDSERTKDNSSESRKEEQTKSS